MYWGEDVLDENALQEEISDMFIGVRFCSDGCNLELRSCLLGRNSLLKETLEKKTGCRVLLHDYPVYYDGSEDWPWWKFW